MEVKVQFNREPLIIFEWPQPKVLNLFLNVMAIQKKKKKGYSWFQNLLYGMAWMSARYPCLKFCPSPALFYGGCSVMIHSLANKILNVSYFVLMCQYDVRYSSQRDTKTGF